MTANQTIDGVSRELAESIIRMLQAGGAWDTADQLRALLDKEVSGDSRAPQPQGESVEDLVRLDRSYRNGLMAGFQFGITGDEKGYATCIQCYNAGIHEAKAEQPAPVAVVMPERSNAVVSANVSAKQAYALGWNACLDELKRLNTL